MLWDFFSQIYRLPMAIFKRALSNPMGIFVYGILSKWYAIVMISTIIITYWVFKGLEKAGVLDAVNAQLKKGLHESQSVAQNCTPLIMNLAEMWQCIQNPPEYVPDANDASLRAGILEDAANNVTAGAAYGNKGTTTPTHNSDTVQNPYDDDDSGSSFDSTSSSSTSPTTPTTPTSPSSPTISTSPLSDKDSSSSRNSAANRI